MGLLDKTNPKATARSVCRSAAVSAAVGAVVFFVCFKPMYREAWQVTLPIWMLLCALVGGLCNWQVADDAKDEEQPGQKGERDGPER